MDEMDASLQSPAVSAHKQLEKAIHRHSNLDFFRGVQVPFFFFFFFSCGVPV